MMKQTPKFMSEMELLRQIRENELGILDAQRTANDLARANMYLRSELNKRRRSKPFVGISVGQMVVIGTTG